MNTQLTRFWPKIGTRTALLLIVAAGFLLRLPGLDRDLWADETWSLFTARGVDVTGKLIVNGPEVTSDVFAQNGGWRELLQAVRSEATPPLYHIFLQIWIKLLGESNRVLRLLSVLFGVSTIFGIFFLGRRMFDEKTGLVAAGMLALFPLHIQYSQEIRPYALAALLVTLATWAYWSAYQLVGRHQEWKYWLLYSGLAAASLYVHPFTAGMLIAHPMVALIQPWSRRLALAKRFVLVAVVTLAFLAPWLLSRYFNDQLQLVKALSHKVPFWDRETLPRMATLMGQLLAGYVPGMRFKSAFGLILLGLYTVSILLPVTVARRQENRQAIIFSFLLFVMPVVFFLSVAAALRELQLVFLFPRYALFAVIGLCLLLAVAIRYSHWRAMPLLTQLMIIVVCLHFQAHWYRANNSSLPLAGFQWFYGNVSRAVEEVSRRARPGELILLEGQHLQLIWNVYDRTNLPQLVLGAGRTKGLHGIPPLVDFDLRWREVESKYGGVYFIGRIGERPSEVVRRLETHYRLAWSKHAGRLQIRHYLKPSAITHVDSGLR